MSDDEILTRFNIATEQLRRILRAQNLPFSHTSLLHAIHLVEKYEQEVFAQKYKFPRLAPDDPAPAEPREG